MNVEKIKKTLISYSFFQGIIDPKEIGKSIDWRLKIARWVSKHKTRTTEENIGIIAGFCLIHRQIEPELQLYQEELQNISTELQEGGITQDEFQNRLMALTTAMLILAFLSGSSIEDEELSLSAIEVLNSGGIDGIEGLDISSLPEEVQIELSEQIAIAVEAGDGLGAEIETGEYEDRQQSLFNRLAMWVTTALGVVSFGKLFLDAGIYQVWLYSPLKDHCGDCGTLHGQVHTVREWNEFFARTGKRPQSRALLCGGWNCGCALYDADGPGVGNFV